MGRLNRTVIEMLQGISYIRGVLEQSVAQRKNPINACTEIERRLWELLEEGEDREKAEPVIAKTGERQEPDELHVDCMNLEPVKVVGWDGTEITVDPEPLELDAVEAVTEPGTVWAPGKSGDVPTSEQEPEGEPKQDDDPKAAEVPRARAEELPGEIPKQTQAGTEAMHRKECRKCGYYSVHTNTCDYSSGTGKVRGIPVAECEYWKDGKQKKPRVYRHICKQCGAEFRDGAARTRFCPRCRGEEQ